MSVSADTCPLPVLFCSLVFCCIQGISVCDWRNTVDCWVLSHSNAFRWWLANFGSWWPNDTVYSLTLKRDSTRQNQSFSRSPYCTSKGRLWCTFETNRLFLSLKAFLQSGPLNGEKFTVMDKTCIGCFLGQHLKRCFKLLSSIESYKNKTRVSICIR